MANSTFIQVPPNVTDPATLKRFLEKLILQLDVAFGNRGTNAFVTDSFLSGNLTSINDVINAINQEALKYIKRDGTRNFTDKISYDTSYTFDDDRNLVDKGYVDDTFEPIIATKNTAFNKAFGTTADTVTEGGTTTNNPEQSAISSLAQTISATYVQSEVQAISSKVDAILVALRNSNIISN